MSWEETKLGVRLSLYLVLSCLGTHDLFLDMGGFWKSHSYSPWHCSLLHPAFSFSVAVTFRVLSSSRFSPLNPLIEWWTLSLFLLGKINMKITYIFVESYHIGVGKIVECILFRFIVRSVWLGSLDTPVFPLSYFLLIPSSIHLPNYQSFPTIPFYIQ